MAIDETDNFFKSNEYAQQAIEIEPSNGDRAAIMWAILALAKEINELRDYFENEEPQEIYKP